MHIVGDLMFLPQSTPTDKVPPLPIPWFIRSPLGLLTDTNVFVSIVRPPLKSGSLHPVGELLISVINPTLDLIHIRCKKFDEPNVLSTAFKCLYDMNGMDKVNIALAEGVTVDHRGDYQISLMCELLHSRHVDEEGHPDQAMVLTRKKEVSRIARSIEETLIKAGFQGWYSRKPQVTPQQALRYIRWVRPGNVVNGLIHDVEWSNKIDEFAIADADSKQYDFSRAVVSCNT